MHMNPAFLLAGAIAATLYFAPTKDPAAGSKDASITPASSTCVTKEPVETGAMKFELTGGTSKWATYDSLE
jgi:hypothetical protein